MGTRGHWRTNGLLGRLPEGMVDAAWLWLVLRVGFGLFAAVLVMKGGLPGPCNSDLVINGWKTFPPLDDKGIAFPLIGVWQHWDACWYAKIAAHGYEAGASSTNFFPLLPLLMSAGSSVLVGDVNFAALAVNAVAFVIGLTGLWQLVHEDFDAQTADRTILYVAIFPVAFFFFAPFTEALFLACAVWAVLGARRQDWELATLAGFLAGLARPQGFLLFLPIGWEAALALRDRWRAGTPGTRPFGWRDLRPIVASVAPVVAFGAYVAFTVLVVGRSYFQSHLTWASTGLHLPWEPLVLAWDWVLQHHDAITLLNLVALILFGVLVVAGLRRMPVSYSLYALPQLGLALTQQTAWPLMSTMRYLLVLFPCFVVLALAGRRPRLHTGWLVLSMLFLGLLTALFLQGNFVA